MDKNRETDRYRPQEPASSLSNDDQNKLDFIVRTHWNDLVTVAKRAGSLDAEATVQEALLHVIRSGISLDANKNAIGYITTAIKRQAIDEWRHGRRYTQESLDHADNAGYHQAHTASLEDRVITNENAKEVRAALHRLSAKERVPVILQAQGYNEKEILEKTKHRKGTVKSLIYRGIAKLRKQFDK